MSDRDPQRGDEAVSDEALMLAVQAGDMTALQGLMTRYEKSLFSFLARYTGDRHLGEDLFQETFVRVMEKRDMFDPAKGFRSWLYAVAANLARDACRRREVRSRDVTGNVEPAREPAGPDEQAGRNEEAEIVRKLLEALPPDARAMVLLHFYQGLRYREMAEVLELPIGTVKSRIHWAVERLTRVWAEGGANALVGISSTIRKG
jgi:RNA polymerase sigma-70 factor (ECF subfamily)